jgi:ATP-binding protein involved in chromosome partitioning
MRYAVPVAKGVLCAHFGHCEQFAIIDTDDTNKTVIKIEHLTPPPHEPGVLPEWLAEEGVGVVIAGGMGSRAQQLFSQNRIKVVVGAVGTDPENVVLDYMQGSLNVGDNICDH